MIFFLGIRRFLLEANSLHGDGGGNWTTDDGYLKEMNFDANMVIILAALLFALILVLALNSILRCALRFSAAERPEEQGAAETGLKKRELRRIPVAAYGSGEVDIAATECAICLGEFIDGERVRVLPQCSHSFHVRCIDTWLVSHSSCPNCRHSLLDLHVAGSS